MKQTLLNQTFKATTILGVCLGMTLIQPAFGSAKIPNDTSTAKNDPKEDEPAKAKKSSGKNRSFTSMNNNSVKIYPDIIKREMHVVAKDNAGKEISFFVFDLQGTLIQNYKMKAKDHYRVSGLKKGTYIYRVFTGDEETASGKFEIR
jgi:Glutamine amidotransferase class-I